MLNDSVVLVAGVALVLACGLALASILLGPPVMVRRDRMPAVVEMERDLAAALGWTWRTWVVARLGSIAVAVILGVLSGVLLLVPVLALAAVLGGRFAVGGYAARRKLRMERAFLSQLRVLRERMALAHQSLDSALLELATEPPAELADMLAPLRSGGSIAENLVQCSQRSRSAFVESACAILLWARTRSLEALIDAIDTVLMPVGEAQLAIEEESLITLTQQRAVTFAMAALMAIMLTALLRVDSFRAYYATPTGTIVLLVALGLFGVLTVAVGRVVRVTRWTRWNLAAMRSEEGRPHA